MKTIGDVFLGRRPAAVHHSRRALGGPILLGSEVRLERGDRGIERFTDIVARWLSSASER